MSEFGRAAGPQPQLRPHPPGDPRPAEGAEGLPPVIPAGEENNRCGLHVCHPLDPTPGLKGTGSREPWRKTSLPNSNEMKGPDSVSTKLSQAIMIN